ncbi:hypothetical protein AMS68_002818 [Peltaster fructicola]|uniref:Uncharacterized protein n=1 Tax=Peltaster fructicola TaxID=286661 RepID=A0A6H0XRL8_9PEZI|nr:hypothetical protein AMS68_002818 [Peltaster fructicola]
MYTPVSRQEKARKREQLRNSVKQDFPRIIQASGNLQDALDLARPSPRRQVVLKPWELPQALKITSTFESTSSELIGSNEAGWAIPGATDAENMILGSSGSGSSDSEDIYGASITSRDDEYSTNVAFEYDDTKHESLAGNSGDDDDARVIADALTASNDSDLVSLSNTSPSSEADAWMGETLCCVESTTRSTTVFPVTPIKQISDGLASSSTPDGSVAKISSMSTPDLAHISSTPSSHILSGKSKHYTTSSEDRLLAHTDKLIITPADGRETDNHSCLTTIIAPPRSYSLPLGSPYQHISAKQHNADDIDNLSQLAEHGTALVLSPSLPHAESLTMWLSSEEQEGTSTLPVNLDLDALTNGEVRIHGFAAEEIEKPVFVAETDLHLGSIPIIDWVALGSGKDDLRESSHYPYWTTNLRQNVNQWLACDDIETATNELKSLTLGSLTDSISVIARRSENATKLRIIHMHLPDYARGLFTHAQPLDWVVIEICWNVPKLGCAILVFPRHCITTIEQTSNTTTWRLLQQGQVPAAYGVGIPPETFKDFMMACALGSAVVNMEVLEAQCQMQRS